MVVGFWIGLNGNFESNAYYNLMIDVCFFFFYLSLSQNARTKHAYLCTNPGKQLWHVLFERACRGTLPRRVTCLV